MNARSCFSRAASMAGGAALLALSACSGTTTTDTVSDPALDTFESDAIYEINRIREDAGVAQILAACRSLNVAATGHSDDMRNKDYLKEVGLDGSTVRTRTCAAGYQPGCSESTAMGELVAKGIDDGKTVVAQWSTNANAHALMVSAGLAVIGVGRSLGEDGTMWWTADLGGLPDSSCQ